MAENKESITGVMGKANRWPIKSNGPALLHNQQSASHAIPLEGTNSLPLLRMKRPLPEYICASTCCG